MSINTLRQVVEATEEFGGFELHRVSLGTFAGTQYRLFVVPSGESAALDTGDQGGGQN
jgi:hypothetical protein